jgi:UDP-glucose 4-epimerase
MVVPRAVASWGLIAASLVALAACESSGLRFPLRAVSTWKRRLNFGTGQGTTVRELLAAVRRVSGRNFRVEYGQRRNGDSPALVADNKAPKTRNWLVASL